MPYASVDFDLWANVDGIIVELVQIDCTYEMNKIPSCTAVLPVGYTAALPATASTAHAATAGVQLQIPISVYVTSTLASSDNLGIWPAGTYKLFCGWVTGVGYRRTYSGYAMTIECTHWLSALTFSSMLSATSHPHNPTHFIFNAAIQGAGGDLNHFLCRTRAQQVVTAVNLAADMWGLGLLPWFQELACQDRIQVAGLGPGAANNDGTAFEARAALDLINPGGNPKLPFNDHGVDGQLIAMAIANDIAASELTPVSAGNTFNAMAHATFWDKIVGELSALYFFKLIPYPEKAKIVPFIPGLRDEWNPGGGAATILARDMSYQDVSASLPRAIRAVGLFGNKGGAAGANLEMADAVNNTEIGGMFVGRPNGVVILKPAPLYMSEFVQKCVFAANAAAIDGGVKANAFNNPDAGVPDPALPDPVNVKEDAKTLMAKLAQALYINEVLKLRYGDIRGPVRFDISPGSTISFQGTEGAIMPANGEKRYGAVTRVHHSFDAHSQKCHTEFRLTHIRTEAEHNDDAFTVTNHPLYTENFVGDYNLTVGTDCPRMVGDCDPEEEEEE